MDIRGLSTGNVSRMYDHVFRTSLSSESSFLQTRAMPPRKKAIDVVPGTPSQSAPTTSRATRGNRRKTDDPPNLTPKAKHASKHGRESESEEEKPATKKVKPEKGKKVSQVDDEPKKMVIFLLSFLSSRLHGRQVTVLKRGAAPVDQQSAFVCKFPSYVLL
jgi:hypothetical protein